MIEHVTRPIALVSMPWSAAKLPSIQLATLDASLRGEGLSSERHELYVDFCSKVTPALYALLANGNEFLIEWLFSRDYFGNETGDWLEAFEKIRPKLDLPNDEYEQEIVEGLKAAAVAFLDDCEHQISWPKYDIVGFSLSTQQLGASIAMARRIKKLHPNTKIIFGGSMCTGSAAAAILRMCPYVDVVVRAEGEQILPELVRTIRAGGSLAAIEGLCYRKTDGVIEETKTPPLFQNNTNRPFLNYDPYFAKVREHGLMKSLNPIMSFESSRGCWWGEKSQCSFCGLHEIMKYRPKMQDFVIAEMEHLAARHNHDRFYAVDLIAPKPFYETFFPELERRGHRWALFYEIKSNVSRKQLVAFADGGGQVIQPGIESLQQASLNRMHKGAHVLQNVQLLKWCRETGIMVYWNYLMSLPGEQATDYKGAADKARKLYHLEPPSTIRDVLITRYAPYHSTPDKHGITNLRPHQFYSKVFPVSQEILKDAAYLFEGDWQNQIPAQDYTKHLKQACLEWKEAAKRGARLDAYKQDGGAIEIIDTRDGAETVYLLDKTEADFYLLLDNKQEIGRLKNKLKIKSSEVKDIDVEVESIDDLLHKWENWGIILKEGTQVLALAVKQWQDQNSITPKRKVNTSVNSGEYLAP